MIDVYEIGAGVRSRVALYRLKRAGIAERHERHRRTQDRWHRRWQAEHTGGFDYLGAVRAWTRSGAYLKMHRRVEQARVARAAEAAAA